MGDEDYIVPSLDFQLMGTEEFSDEATFSHSFTDDILNALQEMDHFEEKSTVVWAYGKTIGHIQGSAQDDRGYHISWKKGAIQP